MIMRYFDLVKIPDIKIPGTVKFMQVRLLNVEQKEYAENIICRSCDNPIDLEEQIDAMIGELSQIKKESREQWGIDFPR